MFITGPDVIKTVTHEEVSKEALGGANAHNQKSGVAHFAADNEQAAISITRELLSYLPSNNAEDPPAQPCDDDPGRVEAAWPRWCRPTPTSPTTSATSSRRWSTTSTSSRCRSTTRRTSSSASRASTAARWASWATTRPCSRAVLDIDASVKAARFVRFCDCFNIPLVTFVDVPGFLPGTSQEWGGIIKHGAKLLYAYAEATVPKVTLITRKAYGGAYDVMASKHIRADINFAYPTAEIAVMGPEGAVNIIFRKMNQAIHRYAPSTWLGVLITAAS